MCKSQEFRQICSSSVLASQKKMLRPYSNLFALSPRSSSDWIIIMCKTRRRRRKNDNETLITLRFNWSSGHVEMSKFLALPQKPICKCLFGCWDMCSLIGDGEGRYNLCASPKPNSNFSFPFCLCFFRFGFQESRAKISCVLWFTVCRAFQPGPNIFVECVIFSEALFHFPLPTLCGLLWRIWKYGHTFGYLKISEGIRKLCFLWWIQFIRLMFIYYHKGMYNHLFEHINVCPFEIHNLVNMDFFIWFCHKLIIIYNFVFIIHTNIDKVDRKKHL